MSRIGQSIETKSRSVIAKVRVEGTEDDRLRCIGFLLEAKTFQSWMVEMARLHWECTKSHWINYTVNFMVREFYLNLWKMRQLFSTDTGRSPRSAEWKQQGTELYRVHSPFKRGGAGEAVGCPWGAPEGQGQRGETSFPNIPSCTVSVLRCVYITFPPKTN